MRKLTDIIVHCTATQPNWYEGKTARQKVLEITKWHKENGWTTIGYHYIIDRDGVVANGRPISQTGAHVAGKNTGSIGIALIGGHGANSNDAFEKNFTVSQENALRTLIDGLMAEHGEMKVTGHNQYSAKACPGFNVPRWYKQQAPRKPYESRVLIGSTTSGVATVVGESVTAAKDSLEPISEFIPTIRIVCIVLALIGVGFAIYARYDDWKNGRQ